MRLNTTLAGLLLLAISNPLIATTIKGVIVANDKGGPGIANVEISAMGEASTVSSLTDGAFVLEFSNKQPGDRVQLVVRKRGMTVVNSYELRVTLLRATNPDPLILLLCRDADVQEMRRRYYGFGGDEPTAHSYQKKTQESEAKSLATKEQLRIQLDLDIKAVAAEKAARLKAEEVSGSYVRGMSLGHRSYEAMVLNRVAGIYRRQNRPDLLSEQNRVEEARQDFDEALEISRALAQQNPTYLPNVAMTLSNIGTLLRQQNRVEEARQKFVDALGLYREQARLNPTIYQPHVAETLDNLGILDLDQNLDQNQRELERARARETARNTFKEALAIYESLASDNPGQYGGEVLSARELLGMALDAILKACREMAQLQPGVYLPYVADTLRDIGLLRYEQNRPEQARKALSDAIAVYGTLVKKNPQYGRDALGIYETLARKSAGRYELDVESAGRVVETAFDVALKLYRDQGRLTAVTYSPDVAIMLINLGLLYRDQNRIAEARKAVSEALDIYESLAKSTPQPMNVIRLLTGPLHPYEQEMNSTRGLLGELTDRRLP